MYSTKLLSYISTSATEGPEDGAAVGPEDGAAEKLKAWLVGLTVG